MVGFFVRDSYAEHGILMLLLRSKLETPLTLLYAKPAYARYAWQCPTRKVSDLFFVNDTDGIVDIFGPSTRSWIRVLGVMEDGSQDSKSISLSHLREELLSSSTKRRGIRLATLHQQVVQSGKSSERTFAGVADSPQKYPEAPVLKLSISSS